MMRFDRAYDERFWLNRAAWAPPVRCCGAAMYAVVKKEGMP